MLDERLTMEIVFGQSAGKLSASERDAAQAVIRFLNGYLEGGVGAFHDGQKVMNAIRIALERRYGISFKELFSPRRTTEYVILRSYCYEVFTRLTNYSQTEISLKWFENKRDRTAILHARRTLASDMNYYPDRRRDFEMFMNLVVSILSSDSVLAYHYELEDGKDRKRKKDILDALEKTLEKGYQTTLKELFSDGNSREKHMLRMFCYQLLLTLTVCSVREIHDDWLKDCRKQSSAASGISVWKTLVSSDNDVAADYSAFKKLFDRYHKEFTGIYGN